MTAPRFDPYSLVHKGQRARLFELTCRAGRLAAGDADGRVALAADVETTLAALADHAEAEDAYFGPLYRAADAAIAATLAADHAGFARGVEEVRAAVAAAIDARDPRSDQALYRALARWTSSYLAHLDVEERSLGTLWSAYDDATIAAAQGRLVASHPPSTVRFNLTQMLPAGSSSERVAFVRNLRRNMPSEAFGSFRAQLDGLLSNDEWSAAVLA